MGIKFSHSALLEFPNFNRTEWLKQFFVFSLFMDLLIGHLDGWQEMGIREGGWYAANGNGWTRTPGRCSEDKAFVHGSHTLPTELLGPWQYSDNKTSHYVGVVSLKNIHHFIDACFTVLASTWESTCLSQFSNKSIVFIVHSSLFRAQHVKYLFSDSHF